MPSSTEAKDGERRKRPSGKRGKGADEAWPCENIVPDGRREAAGHCAQDYFLIISTGYSKERLIFLWYQER